MEKITKWFLVFFHLNYLPSVEDTSCYVNEATTPLEKSTLIPNFSQCISVKQGLNRQGSDFILKILHFRPDGLCLAHTMIK